MFIFEVQVLLTAWQGFLLSVQDFQFVFHEGENFLFHSRRKVFELQKKKHKKEL